MRFLSCRYEGSILADEPTEMRALLTSCGPSGSEVVIGGSDRRPLKLRVFSLEELETATGGFGKERLLGRGSHGCLYKGTLKDGKLVVAVKRQENLQDEAAFNNELEILSTLHSPRFVNLVGFSRGLLDAQERLLVVDFMANGTLHDILHSSSSTNANAAPAAAEPLLGWGMRVQIALQTAKALLALHSASPPVIHRDVKSSSVFIDSKWNAKLGDFGLSVRGHSEDVKRGAGPGSASPVAAAVGHTDPDDETPSSRISTKVDVFSFGILLLEILSGRNAIDVRFKPPSILDWALPLIKEGKAHAVYDRRLLLLPHQEQHSKGLRHMAGIAARCVRTSSRRRPSMSYVVAALQEVSKKIQSAKWAGGLATVMKMTTSSCQAPQALRDVRSSPEFNHGVSSIMREPRVAVDRPMPSGKAQLPSAAAAAERGVAVEHPYSHSKEVLSGFDGRQARSMDRSIGFRLREPSTRSARELGVVDSQQAHVVHHSSRHDNEQKEDEGEDEADEAGGGQLPRATTEKSSRGRRIVYSQWRNPMFDVEIGSPPPPERALVIPVEICRLGTTQWPGDKPVYGGGAKPSYHGGEGRAEAVSNRSTASGRTTARAAAVEDSACMPSLPLSKVRSRNVKSSSRKSHAKTRDNFEREEAILPW